MESNRFGVYGPCYDYHSSLWPKNNPIPEVITPSVPLEESIYNGWTFLYNKEKTFGSWVKVENGTESNNSNDAALQQMKKIAASASDRIFKGALGLGTTALNFKVGETLLSHGVGAWTYSSYISKSFLGNSSMGQYVGAMMSNKAAAAAVTYKVAGFSLGTIATVGTALAVGLVVAGVGQVAYNMTCKQPEQKVNTIFSKLWSGIYSAAPAA